MKIAIIGAGATGMGVASKLAREHERLDIHVFQKQNYISLGSCSIPYFIANDFKKQALLNVRTPKDFKNEKQYKSKIHFHLNHTVSNINTNKNQLTYENKKKEKKTIKYQYLVIATGAKANIVNPFNQKPHAKNLFTVVTKEDAINIKEKIKTAQNIVIIGGSFIGLEMAETCLKLKKTVTIIEMKERLMSDIFTQDFSQLIYQEITGQSSNQETNKKHKHHTKILLNTIIKTLEIKDDVITSLKTNNDDRINCDLVILATGFQPNTDFLKESNIKLAKNNAIVINEYGQVLIEDYINNNEKNPTLNAYNNIFSGGDCATIINQNNQTNNYLPLATSANKIARIIAHNIMYPYKKESWPGTLGASIIRIKDLELAKVGIKDEYWKPENIASVYVESNDIPSYFSFSKPLYLKLFYDKVSYQILGAEIAGYNKSTLRIDALAIAIWNKMDVRDLQYVDLVYSPPFATTSDIIHIAAKKIK
ncbi:MAG: FAD-dependent oxidoreductase [Spiroplasma sp.]